MNWVLLGLAFVIAAIVILNFSSNSFPTDFDTTPNRFTCFPWESTSVNLAEDRAIVSFEGKSFIYDKFLDIEKLSFFTECTTNGCKQVDGPTEFKFQGKRSSDDRQYLVIVIDVQNNLYGCGAR